MKPSTDSDNDPPQFAGELTAWRTRRGLNKQQLAARLHVHPSYVSHLEAGRQSGSAQVARDADTVLDAGGAIWKAWQHSDQHPTASDEAPASGGGLVVLDDDAELHYDGTRFRLRMRRRLANTGTEPVTRYLARISVDRHPDDPARSKELYRSDPLTLAELDLHAWCDGREMTWTVKQDHDAVKEIWLEFASGRSRFPLYPGQQTEITYAYEVRDDKWGPWFQRAVRLPTRRLAVSLTFPTRLGPQAWGTETSMSETEAALRTPMQVTVKDEHTVFAWSTLDPPLNARYRMEWLFTASRRENPPVEEPQDPATVMTAAGIVQEGDPRLSARATLFVLPDEADTARSLVTELKQAAARIRRLHVFGKGMGIAAPQINSPHGDRAAAIVIPPDPGADLVVLLNPEIVDSSHATDEQYEGCLSFFGVRGRVPRPRTIEVAHTSLDGRRQVTEFRDGMARLVAHEIDHLNGVLYRTRMRDDDEPIPYAQYKGTGSNWSYG